MERQLVYFLYFGIGLIDVLLYKKFLKNKKQPINKTLGETAADKINYNASIKRQLPKNTWILLSILIIGIIVAGIVENFVSQIIAAIIIISSLFYLLFKLVTAKPIELKSNNARIETYHKERTKEMSKTFIQMIVGSVCIAISIILGQLFGNTLMFLILFFIIAMIINYHIVKG